MAVRELQYGVIGAGRMARHFTHYLRLLQVPFLQWTRRDGEPPLDALSGCNVFLVLIKDSEIERFVCERLSGISPSRIVHFSGSLHTPLARGFHPLMTFGAGFYELKTYESIPFICDTEPGAFEKLFPMLRNPRHSIAPEFKPLYHALCVLSGNFTTLLWQKAFHDFETKLGIPKEVLHSYLERTKQNLIDRPEEALTGPLARGDRETLAKNLHALANDPFRGVYEAFVKTRTGNTEPPSPPQTKEGEV